MKSEKIHDKSILSLATNAVKTSNRAYINDAYSNFNFIEWSSTALKKYKPASVLDLCCGTGNQLVLYEALYKNCDITGVDISNGALNKARERLKKENIHLYQADVGQFIKDNVDVGKKYDLVSCFYGLYYLENVEEIIPLIYKLLTDKGQFLVCGPYGENNQHLFDLLEEFYPIPEFVKYSSSYFMEQTLIPLLKAFGFQFQLEKAKNTITFPKAELLIKYIKSSTFFNEDYIEQVEKRIVEHFTKANNFSLEKHILLINSVKQ